MSEIEPKPLSPELQELLRQAPRPVPPPGFAEAVRRRVDATLQGPGSGGEGAPESAKGVPAPPKLMGTWGIPVSIATLVLGLGAGTLVGSKLAAPEPRPVVISEVKEQPVAPPEVAQAAATAEKPPELAEREAAASPKQQKATRVPRPVAAPVEVKPNEPDHVASRDLELAEERALIERARTSLARRETARALQTLEEHARRHPEGQLAEERESLWVQALVTTGSFTEAKQKAEAFRANFPESMLLPAVEAVIESIADETPR